MSDEERDSPLKVSDWSQKYKLAVYAIAILGFGGWVWFYLMPWMASVQSLLQTIAHK
jgi:hypothetical protein